MSTDPCSFDIEQMRASIREERGLLSGNSNEFFQAQLKSAALEIDGQTLHPKLQYLRETGGTTKFFEDLEKQPGNWDNAEKRELIRIGVELDWVGRAIHIDDDVETVRTSFSARDGSVLKLLISRPTNANNRHLPVILYFHGGGFLVGSADSLQPHAKLLATRCQALVVNVSYRLAPEHAFPISFYDGFDSYDWCISNAQEFGGDPDRISAAGDSAGGTICLALAREQHIRKQRPLHGLLLYYPLTDTSTHYDSYKKFGHGFGLDKNFAEKFLNLVCATDQSRRHPYICPLGWPDKSFLPPAVFAIAGFDILRDQGLEFAAQMTEAGCIARVCVYDRLNHSFLKNAGVIDDAMNASYSTAELFRQLLYRAAV